MKPKSKREHTAPEWVKYRGNTFTKSFNIVRSIVDEYKIATVCEVASCPNRTECWSSGTATFLLMGDICTRNCRFCRVKTAKKPPPLDPNEPYHLAEALRNWKLNYVVITSVDRDDLLDGGSLHLSKCIEIVKKEHPDLRIEILIPDFMGNPNDIKKIVDVKPEVIAHNIETVRRLTPKIRDRRASYDQSLRVLKVIKDLDNKIFTKSSIMLGFFEKKEEIIETMQDLRRVNVDFLTIGQYMRPSLRQVAVKEYISPEDFMEYQEIGYKMGFQYVVSKPLVRSSYRAGKFFIEKIFKNKIP